LATVGIEMLKILPAVPAKKVPSRAVARSTRLIRLFTPIFSSQWFNEIARQAAQ
jgi:hypothetical protein